MSGRKVFMILLLVAVLALAAFSVWTLYELNGGSLNLTGRHAVLVVSDSMDGNVTGYDVDSFPENSIVMVRDVTKRDLYYMKVGQVISYEENGFQIYHRISEVHDGYVYATGDNGHSLDKVYLEDIDGIVVGANPWLGKTIHVIDSNFLLFLAAMFAVCSAMVLAVFLRTDRMKEVD